ncbi:MAG TPA: S1C family serine protease [Gemmatimonadales bacterium]|nr:S1C family serine protease [Gemmatimonadales bacterium]
MRLSILHWSSGVKALTAMIGVLAGGLAATGAVFCQQPLTTPELVSRVRSSVVTIETLDRVGRLLSQGTGVAVGEVGRVLTNFHVVDGAASAMVTLRSGESYSVEGFVSANPTRDVVVLAVRDLVQPTLELSLDTVTAGEGVVVVGSPLGFQETVTTGVASGFTVLEGVSWLQVSAMSSPGGSGSPVLDSFGRVLGLVSRGASQAPQITLAVPASVIRSMLASPGGTKPLSDLPQHDRSSGAPPVAESADEPVGITGFYQFARLEGTVFDYAWIVQNPGGRVSGALFSPHQTGFFDLYPIREGRLPGQRRDFELTVGCFGFEGWIRDDGLLAGDTYDKCEKTNYRPFEAVPVWSDPTRTQPLEGVKRFRVRSRDRAVDGWIVIVGPRNLGEGTVGAVHLWGSLIDGTTRKDLLFPRGRASRTTAELASVDGRVTLTVVEERGMARARIGSGQAGRDYELEGFREDLADCLDIDEAESWRSTADTLGKTLRAVEDSIRVIDRVLAADSLRLNPPNVARVGSGAWIWNQEVQKRRRPHDDKRAVLDAQRAEIGATLNELRRRIDAIVRCP